MSPTLEQSLSNLSSRGFVLTLQRRAIIEFLHARPGHWTAEAIYTRLRSRYESLSRATIYKTLELLCDAGEMGALRAVKEVTHYDTNTESHHHFHCDGCGSLFDLHIQCPIQTRCCVEAEGHVVSRSVAVFSGTCRGCAKGS
jgi:Fe2+ or Zn2+ uptake regulation protein